MPVGVRIIAWCLFCIIDGAADAFMYHLKSPEKKVKLNEHYILSARRLIVGIGILFELDRYVLPTAIVFIMYQPFFHNNAYYISRHLLDRRVYSISIFNQSQQSTAKLTKFFDPYVRIILSTFATYISVILSCLYSM